MLVSCTVWSIPLKSTRKKLGTLSFSLIPCTAHTLLWFISHPWLRTPCIATPAVWFVCCHPGLLTPTCPSGLPTTHNTAPCSQGSGHLRFICSFMPSFSSSLCQVPFLHALLPLHVHGDPAHKSTYHSLSVQDSHIPCSEHLQ